MARTDDKPRGEAEFTQTIPSREGRRRKATDDKPRGEAEFTQTIPRREGRRRKSTDDKPKERLVYSDYPEALRKKTKSNRTFKNNYHQNLSFIIIF